MCAWESTLSGSIMEMTSLPKPQNLIFGTGAFCKLALDNVRSRKNTIDKPKHAFPKFGILDVVEAWDDSAEMNGEDMVLIDAGDGDPNDVFSWIHYQKATLYPYPTALNILERGVCSSQGLITRSDFKGVVKPGKKITCEERATVFKKMTDLINNAIEATLLSSKATDKLEKNIFLAMIGSWANVNRTSIDAIESTHEDDFSGVCTIQRHIGEGVHLFGSKKQ